MKVTVLYIGSSLLAPLKNAERELNRDYNLGLRLAACNFGSPLSDSEWVAVENDLKDADVVFVIHVMDGENAARLIPALEEYRTRHAAVIVINCMPDLMRRTRMGRLDVSRLAGAAEQGNGEKGKGQTERKRTRKALGLLTAAGSWVGRQVKRSKVQNGHKHGHGQYLKFIDKLPGILRFVPTAGGLRDVKHYLNIFCYFLQPTPANIRSMILYALKQYVPDDRLTKAKIKIPPPQHMPSVAIYHPDSAKLFETFEEYREWYTNRSGASKVQRTNSTNPLLDPGSTIGLLLMRPQVVSKTTRHYDALLRAIEAEGLSVIPALSTLMDNREACEKFFVENKDSKVQSPTPKPKTKDQRPKAARQGTDNGPLPSDRSRISQIVSLTGFSFVGGPAMNDSEAAAEFLQSLNRPYRSAVSLDMQTI
ncbi:MAG: cobaltochelatase subunit CobN, partial [Acidobacteriota bacterium]|nr:cobaltochelatase subunit CobN [Acidobacteriota bacterium]